MKLRIFTALLLTLCALFTSAFAYTDMDLVDPEFLTPYFPDHTLLSGVDEGDTLYLLMQNPAGETVFIGGTQSESGEWSFVESTPLPEGAILGDDNLYYSLRIPTDEYSIGVTLAPFHDGSWGVSTINYSYNEPIRIGRNWISDWYPLWGYLGNHPWSDITVIDWTTLPRTYDEAVAQVDSSRWALVKDAFALLYSSPDDNADILGEYVSGAPVCIAEPGDEYTRVLIGQAEGWMLTEQLAFNEEIFEVHSLDTAFLTTEETLVYTQPDETSHAYLLAEQFPDVYVLGTVPGNWAHIWLADIDLYGYVSQDSFSYGDG